MKRRNFLSGSLALTALAIGGRPGSAEQFPAPSGTERRAMMSVDGWLKNPGIILPHEHILVDFIGAARVSPSRYNPDDVFKTALPKLRSLKAAGCDTLVECTPAYLGRDVKLLARLSGASGLHILTNTGYYGARHHLFLPEEVSRESSRQLAARWIKEWEQGIDGSGIKPGFIKTGADKAPLSALQRKIVRAAAFTHLETGLAIGIHTGDGEAAEEELAILEREGVRPDAFIWIHAQSERDHAYHTRLARKGVWIEFDGINDDSMELHLQLLQVMKAKGLLHKSLVSQDGGWYHAGEAGGGDYRGYTLLFTEFLPLLKRNGFTAGEIAALMQTNPFSAFALPA